MNVCPRCNLSDIEMYVAGYCPSCAGEIIGKLENRIKELEVLCWRESGVLFEALNRKKNNKSMIKVVAESLKEQALKGDK